MHSCHSRTRAAISGGEAGLTLVGSVAGHHCRVWQVYGGACPRVDPTPCGRAFERAVARDPASLTEHELPTGIHVDASAPQPARIPLNPAVVTQDGDTSGEDFDAAAEH